MSSSINPGRPLGSGRPDSLDRGSARSGDEKAGAPEDGPSAAQEMALRRSIGSASTGFHATSPPSPIRPPAAANSCARNLASLDRLKESRRRPCTDYRHGSKPEGEHQAAAAEHIPIKPRGQVGIGLYLNAWSDDPEHLPACGQSGRVATVPFSTLRTSGRGVVESARHWVSRFCWSSRPCPASRPCPTLKLPRIPRPGRPWKRSGPVAAGSPT